MRTLLASALAAVLAGCSCPVRPQTGMETCGHMNGLACLDEMAVDQPIELIPESLKTGNALIERQSPIAPTIKKGSSTHVRSKIERVVRKANVTTIAMSINPPGTKASDQSRLSEPRLRPLSNTTVGSNTTREDATDVLRSGAATNSSTKTTQEQVAAAMAVAERMTVVMHDDTENVGHASPTPGRPSNPDLLVAILMARTDIKLVSDLSNAVIAIDDRLSSSNGNIRTAIVAAGAAEVQLSEGHENALDRVVSKDVSAAVLTLASPDAAEHFPDIVGFKIFRIPLSPFSLKTRQDKP